MLRNRKHKNKNIDNNEEKGLMEEEVNHSSYTSEEEIINQKQEKVKISFNF